MVNGRKLSCLIIHPLTSFVKVCDGAWDLGKKFCFLLDVWARDERLLACGLMIIEESELQAPVQGYWNAQGGWKMDLLREKLLRKTPTHL